MSHERFCCGISWFQFPDRVQAIREQAKFAVRVKSVVLLFEPLDTSGSKAGTQFAHTCGRDVDLVGGLHAATDKSLSDRLRFELNNY